MQSSVGKREIKGGATNESVCGQGEAKPEELKEITFALAPLDSTDMPIVRAWRNDYQIWQWCRQNDLISDVDQTRWFEAQAKDPSIKMYKAVLSNGEKIATIGVCGFTSIDFINRRAEFSLYIAPAYQGQHFGSKILNLLISHGFQNLGLHLIWGEVFSGNPALSIFKELGFQEDGIRRDFYFRNGKFINAHIISIKESEWNSILLS